MTSEQLRKLSSRQRLLRCARDAATCQYLRRYGPVRVDLGYLDSASDDRLRTIVRAWFGTDDVDGILLSDAAYQGLA